MQGASRQFLAGAGFAAHQHGGTPSADHPDNVADLAHFVAFPDQQPLPFFAAGALCEPDQTVSAALLADLIEERRGFGVSGQKLVRPRRARKTASEREAVGWWSRTGTPGAVFSTLSNSSAGRQPVAGKSSTMAAGIARQLSQSLAAGVGHNPVTY